MVVKEDGTKWACQSCLKGHRVSGCTHTDRPLIFVPKKGRPVTQCQHCRVERKKRSAHVKCDCGEKAHHLKDKCVHLRHAEGAGHEGHELDPVPEDCQLEDASCCCHHGESCICASLKKDSGSDSDHPHVPHHRTKPRLTTTHSDGYIPPISNGHHKPAHRHNHAAHDALPYKLPRSHTDHAHTTGRRSVDSATSEKNKSSVSLSSQPAFNFATPPEEPSMPSSRNMSTDNLVMDGFPFIMDQSQPQASTTNSMNFYDFAQFGSSTNGVNGFDMSMAQNDASMNAFAMPSASSVAPVSAASSEPALDWNNFDWAAMTSIDDAQPALTYASSNTRSEFGEHTPPEEFGSLFGNQNFMRSMQDMAGQIDQSTVNGNAPSVDMEMNQPSGQPNRWSLPHSFWTGIADNTSSANISTEIIPGNSNDWASSDQTTQAKVFAAQPNTLARSNTSASVGPPRPKAVYQKTNATLPGDPGWERLLQQYQAGELWGEDGLGLAAGQSQIMTDVAVSPLSAKTTISAPVDNLLEQNLDVSMLQPNDNDEQFFMDPESIGPFDFNGDFPTPGFTNGAWPQ